MIQDFGPSFCSFKIFKELSILSRIEDQFFLVSKINSSLFESQASLPKNKFGVKSDRNR
jgi:hypothetical protein